MGNSHSSASKSKAIDKQIKVHQKRLNREVKILLLGEYIDSILHIMQEKKRRGTYDFVIL